MRASATVSQPFPIVASTTVSPGRMTARHSVCAMSVVRLLVTMTSSKCMRVWVEVAVSAAAVAPIDAWRSARVTGPIVRARGDEKVEQVASLEDAMRAAARDDPARPRAHASCIRTVSPLELAAVQVKKCSRKRLEKAKNEGPLHQIAVAMRDMGIYTPRATHRIHSFSAIQRRSLL